MLNIELSKVCSTGPASMADNLASIRSKVSHEKERKGANASMTAPRGAYPEGSALSTNRMAPSTKATTKNMNDGQLASMHQDEP